MPDSPLKPGPTALLPTPSLSSPSLRYAYNIGRGEMGVLTFEPYKSLVLPFWAFRTVPIATNSAQILWDVFESYVGRGDFVGADMTRKFIQMGMTRARRYANHKGGRKWGEDGKWVGGDGEGEGKSPAQKEKGEASRVFEGFWRRCLRDQEYQRLKEEWRKEKKAYVPEEGEGS